MFFVETVHGVVIDAVTDLAYAKRVAEVGYSNYRVVPARVFSIQSGKKVYH